MNKLEKLKCGNNVSTTESKRSKDMAVPKEKTGCLGCIGVVFLIFIVTGLISSLMEEGSDTSRLKLQSQSTTGELGLAETKAVHKEEEVVPTETTEETKAVHKEGETVHVGYMSYVVLRSWWSNRLSSNPFLDEPLNAAYLFVKLIVRNDDKKARMIPPFKLLDQDGAEYETDSNEWVVDGAINIFESLNPSVSKQGFVVFDVPKDRIYRLKLSGGYWSAEDTYVRLSPKPSR